jgi:hypothetical protein
MPSSKRPQRPSAARPARPQAGPFEISSTALSASAGTGISAAHADTSFDTPADRGAAPDASSWREQLSALRAAGTLDEAQETDFHRLLAAHEAEVRERMPALLDTFQQDIAARGPDAAKQALTAALQAIKDRQRDELLRMLEGAGADVSELRR